MFTRRIVAALVLALLPMMMMAAEGTAMPTPEAAWGAFWGMGGWDAFWWGVTGAVTCSFLPVVGSIPCGIVGAA